MKQLLGGRLKNRHIRRQQVETAVYAEKRRFNLTAAAEESASAANEMTGMATNLQGLVAKFQLQA